MRFASLAGVLWGCGLTALTVGVLLRGGRGGAGWVLLAALVSTPWVPAPFVPIRAERTLYAGPDLLSDVPVREVVLSESTRAAGLSRIRTLRATQGTTLLSERRRVEIRVPWLWAAAMVLVALGGRVGRSAGGTASARAGLLCMAIAPTMGSCGGEPGPGLAELRLKEVVEMRATGDVSAIEEVFLPEAVYEDVAGDFEHRGVPEIAEHLRGLHRWASGVFLDVIDIHGGPEWAAAEWLLEGVQSGPVPGRLDTVTGRRFQLRGVTLVELERGGVIRAVDYLDWVPFLLDVGAEVHWPGGGVTSPSGGEGGGVGPEGAPGRGS